MRANRTVTAALGVIALVGCTSIPPASESSEGVSVSVEPGPAAARCAYGQVHPDAPAEIEQFGFLIGDFEITSHIMTPNGWSPPRPGPRARWNGWWGLGGLAVYDEWYDPDPGLDPAAPRGVNVRYYDDQAAVWKMMWISDTGRQVQDLRAELRDGKLTMWQVYPERPDFLADFTVENPDHWYRISYVKDEAGEWTPQYKLRASRIACGS